MAILLNPAECVIEGEVDKEQTWYEDIVLVDEDGEQLTGVDEFLWELTLYKCPGNEAVLTLSTDDGTLVITETTSTVLSIRCASTRLSAFCAGRYNIDIKTTDTDTTVDGEDRTVLRARGTVTITEGPL